MHTMYFNHLCSCERIPSDNVQWKVAHHISPLSLCGMETGLPCVGVCMVSSPCIRRNARCWWTWAILLAQSLRKQRHQPSVRARWFLSGLDWHRVAQFTEWGPVPAPVPTPLPSSGLAPSEGALVWPSQETSPRSSLGPGFQATQIR